MTVNEFVLGRGSIPSWFNEKCLKGQAKVEYDDENQIIGATVHTPIKTVKANIGDTIVLLKSGLQVIPKQKVVQNRPQKVKNNEEFVTKNKNEVE